MNINKIIVAGLLGLIGIIFGMGMAYAAGTVEIMGFSPQMFCALCGIGGGLIIAQ